MRNLNENDSYHVKLIRLWEPEPKLIWEGNCYLHIQRRPNGDIGVLTPKLNRVPLVWAEYCQEDMVESLNNHHIHCICEDYLMWIL
jgi:hypothetical protein